MLDLRGLLGGPAAPKPVNGGMSAGGVPKPGHKPPVPGAEASGMDFGALASLAPLLSGLLGPEESQQPQAPRITSTPSLGFGGPIQQVQLPGQNPASFLGRS